jgi:ASC-1-like (ASCH) protein
MHLNPIPFEQIRKGDKKIEIWLFDEKRQNLNIK